MKNPRVTIALAAAFLFAAACSDDDSASSHTSATTSTSSASASSAGSTSSGTGGAADACDSCVQHLIEPAGSCVSASPACSADMACLDWANCVNDCSLNDWSAACLDACQRNLGTTSTALAQAFVDCLCNDCSSPCGLICSTPL